MGNPEKHIGLMDVVKELADTARSKEMKDSLLFVGEGFNMISRWSLATILHPVATFKAGMMIGDYEAIGRSADRALSIPGLSIERDSYRRGVAEQFRIRAH